MYIRGFTELMDEGTYSIRNRINRIIACNLLFKLLMLGVAISMCIPGFIIVAISSIGGEFSAGMMLIGVVCIIVITLLGINECNGASIINIVFNDFCNKGAAGDVSYGIKKLKTMIIYSFIKIGVAIPFLIIGVLLYLIFGSIFKSIPDLDIRHAKIAVLILIFLSVLLFLCLAILCITLYKTMLIFVVPTITLENLSAAQGFKRSLQLLKGDFWKIFKKVLLLELGSWTISYSLGLFVAVMIAILAGILKMVFGSVNMVVITQATQVLQWGLKLVAGLVITAIYPAVSTLFYIHEACKKEGYDLKRKLRQLEEKQTT